MLYVESKCLKGVHFEDIASEIGHYKTQEKVKYYFYRGWGEPRTTTRGGYDLSSLDGAEKEIEEATRKRGKSSAALGAADQDEWVKQWQQKKGQQKGAASESESESSDEDDAPKREPTAKHIEILKVPRHHLVDWIRFLFSSIPWKPGLTVLCPRGAQPFPL